MEVSAPAPGRVAVEPATGAPAGAALLEIRTPRGEPVRAAAWAVFRGAHVLAS